MKGDQTVTYRLAMSASRPLAIWGRLQVEGLEALPPAGPVILVGNHDSEWDPVLIGIAARRRRQIRALAKSSLWRRPGLGFVLDGMNQIPVERGGGNVVAFERATAELRAGACIGIFLEGTTSKGLRLRARSGVGRLIAAVPEAKIVMVAIEGVTDLVRFPRRPAMRARFLEPAGGQPRPGEEPGELAARLLGELRELVPPAAAGRGN